MAQRVGRGIALFFHDRDTIRGLVFSSTPRPLFTPGKDLVPIVQEAGWAPGPVCTGGKSRPHRESIPDRPARIQSLYQLSYRAHHLIIISYKYERSVQEKCGYYQIYEKTNLTSRQNNSKFVRISCASFAIAIYTYKVSRHQIARSLQAGTSDRRENE